MHRGIRRLGSFDVVEEADRIQLKVRWSVLAQLALCVPLASLVPLLFSEDPGFHLFLLVVLGSVCWGGLPFLFARTCATSRYRRVRRSIVIRRYRKSPAAGGLEIDGRAIPLDELRRVVVGPESPSSEDDGVCTAPVHLVTQRCVYWLGKPESPEAGELATLFRRSLPLKRRGPKVAPEDLADGFYARFFAYLFGAAHALASIRGSFHLVDTLSSGEGSWSPRSLRLAGVAWLGLEIVNLWLGGRIMGLLLRGPMMARARRLGVE